MKRDMLTFKSSFQDVSADSTRPGVFLNSIFRKQCFIISTKWPLLPQKSPS